ncbi:UNVERIFIED_CONTAM: hypothetical protein FKN15_074761 [Acipenser sinensis]
MATVSNKYGIPKSTITAIIKNYHRKRTSKENYGYSWQRIIFSKNGPQYVWRKKGKLSIKKTLYLELNMEVVRS